MYLECKKLHYSCYWIGSRQNPDCRNGALPNDATQSMENSGAQRLKHALLYSFHAKFD